MLNPYCVFHLPGCARVKIFLSYASKYRAIADDLCCRLQAARHDVFFDREDLPVGISFDAPIRQAI
jgi:hypothetical protein